MTENSVKYTLKSPVKDDNDNDVSELTFREPTVGDMIAVEEYEGSELAQTMLMLRRMARVSEQSFAQIGATDIAAITELTMKKWGDALGNGPEDGESSPS